VQASEYAGGGGERTRYLDLTPALAEEWLERHHFAGQRAIHPDRVDAYANDMRNGLFGPSDFHFAVLDDWEPMMNGRHRCQAVLASNCTVPARVHEIPIAKKEDAGVVYSWFDVAGLRTAPEILSAMGTQVSAGLLPVMQAACNLIVAGFEMVPEGSGMRVRSSTSLEIKRRVIEEWEPYARAYLDLICGQSEKRRRILQRQNVMSVGMATMRYAKAKAAPFWLQLAANDGLRPETPQHVLMDLFLEKKSSEFPHYVWARLVAHAWNNYHEGRSLKILRIGSAAIRDPILILGTPYNGRTVRAYAFATGEAEKATP
jgi:hypothetical protein